jgi:hypothetical protein
MSFATTDLCDDHANLLDDGRLAVLPPVFRTTASASALPAAWSR